METQNNILQLMKRHMAMAKWYRCNPYLGCQYEITEKEAQKKLKSPYWVPVWDDYFQKFSNHAWYNVKDFERDWIFKED